MSGVSPTFSWPCESCCDNKHKILQTKHMKFERLNFQSMKHTVHPPHPTKTLRYCLHVNAAIINKYTSSYAA